jgi:2-amino-4-hydroxy-6-hydroxymethyldihydropteridine diphosphokinase
VTVRAFIGLGGNLGDAAATLRRAFDDLELVPASRLVARSPLYANPPLGPVAQGEFVNAVALLETGLAPRALLGELRRIEAAHGRTRDGTRWGPRTLDLDLLLHGDAVLDDPDLHLPHRGLPTRNFVLYPLADLDPALTVPGAGPLRELLARCPADGLRRLD